MMRTAIVPPQHRLFDAVQGGFGRPLRTAYGEPSFLRVRSYIRGACVPPEAKRAHEPMIVGEIREVTCVTMNTSGRSRSGTFAVLRCFLRHASGVPEDAVTAAMPRPNEPRLSLMYGLSILPTLLVDQHNSKGRKKDAQETIHGYKALWFASVDVTTASMPSPHNPRVLIPCESRICPSTSIFTLTEWILGVANRSKYPYQTFMIERVSKQAYDFEYAKLCSKLNAQFQSECDHPTADDLGVQTATDVDEVKKVARMMSELTTPGFLLDLIACDTLTHCHLASFTNSKCIPLYISMCIVLAATPSLIWQWVPNSNGEHTEESRSVGKVFDVYRATNYGHPTTILETLVEIASEQMRPDTKIGGIQQLGNKPLSSEHMRRQGVALCHELASVLHTECASYVGGIESQFCGEDAWKEACGALTPECLIESAKLDQRHKGICGSARQLPAFETRCATRTTRMRHLVQMMSDVNEVLETGVFRMRREFEENTGEAAVRHSGVSPPLGRINTAAWSTMLDMATNYLIHGPLVIHESGQLNVFPLRHRTRTTCAKCRRKFDVATSATRGAMAQCTRCHAFLCSFCYGECVRNEIRCKVDAAQPPTALCSRCSPPARASSSTKA